MRVRPVHFVLISSCLALLLVSSIPSHGQSPDTRRRVVTTGTAPPAIERGIVADESRSPDSVETKRRTAIRSSAVTIDRAGAGGSHYVAGRVIVKFKEGTAGAARLSAMSAVSRTAAMEPRASWANFDVMRIDPGEDPEAVARQLAARPDVEDAQAAYRMRPLLVPNDKFYPLQWNLPLLDMERAWDIQPSAASAITVAVIDTGVAYTSATARFHASAFRDENGVLYPSLGDLTLSFVPATELQPSTRFV